MRMVLGCVLFVLSGGLCYAASEVSVAAAGEVIDSLPLHRSAAVDVRQKTLQKQLLNQMALFCGVMFHAFRSMYGNSGSLLRKGFSPMLCYGMCSFLRQTYADADSHLVEKCVAFITKHCNPLHQTFFSQKEFRVMREIDVLKSAYSDFIKRCGVITEEELATINTQLDRMVARCQTTQSLESRLNRLDPAFVGRMDVARRKFEVQHAVRTCPILDRLIHLQYALYTAVNTEKGASSDWWGLVPHYMNHYLGLALASEYVTDSKLFLWVSATPLTDQADFFTSVQYLDCLQTYFSEGIVRPGAATVMSMVDIQTCIADKKVLSMLDAARDQVGLAKVHASTLIRHMLTAFDAFQERVQ